MLSLHIITFPQGYVGPCVPCLQYFSLSSIKDADKRHHSILSFLCMRQRRTKYKVKVTGLVHFTDPQSMHYHAWTTETDYLNGWLNGLPKWSTLNYLP